MNTKINFADLCMLAGITYLSFKSRRQVSMFAIFCGPILANVVAQFINKYDNQCDLALPEILLQYLYNLL